MKKILIILGVVLLNGMLFSCSNDDDQDLNSYKNETKLFATGGEDEQIIPPPPPPVDPE